jgi:hypothetical protein
MASTPLPTVLTGRARNKEEHRHILRIGATFRNTGNKILLNGLDSLGKISSGFQSKVFTAFGYTNFEKQLSYIITKNVNN